MGGSGAPDTAERLTARGGRLVMASHSVLASNVAIARHPFVDSTVLSDYGAMTKPEVNFLIAITTATAFYIGSPEALPVFPWIRLLHTIFGTMLVASGAATLNQ